MTETNLIRSQTTAVTVPRLNLDEVECIARLAVKSGVFPKLVSVEKAMIKIMYGMEMGLSPMTALSHIHSFTGGRPQMDYILMGAKIRQHPHYDTNIVEMSRKRCEIQFLYNGQPMGPNISVTLQELIDNDVALDSDKEKLKDNYAKFSDDMLYSRCLSKGVRRYFPDLFDGPVPYTPEEITDDDMQIEVQRMPSQAIENGVASNQIEFKKEDTTNVYPEPEPEPVETDPTPSQESEPVEETQEENDNLLPMKKREALVKIVNEILEAEGKTSEAEKEAFWEVVINSLQNKYKVTQFKDLSEEQAEEVEYKLLAILGRAVAINKFNKIAAEHKISAKQIRETLENTTGKKTLKELSDEELQTALDRLIASVNYKNTQVPQDPEKPKRTRRKTK